MPGHGFDVTALPRVPTDHQPVHGFSIYGGMHAQMDTRSTGLEGLGWITVGVFR